MSDLPQQETAEAVNQESRAQKIKRLVNKLYEDYEVIREFKPLEIGTHKKLAAIGFAETQALVAVVLSRHTQKGRYYKSIVAGGKRYALDGSESGEVTAEQQAKAKEQLNQRYAEKAKHQKAAPEPKQVEVQANNEKAETPEPEAVKVQPSVVSADYVPKRKVLTLKKKSLI